MPPEPLPWDRKDFFRERRHSYDRPPEPMGGGGGVGRWRDSSSSSHGSSRNEFARWGFPSEFRRPPGHARQGGWHSYSEDFVHGYNTPRSCDRFVEDGGFRPYGPRGDGRYSKNFRENRGSYSHKEWRNHSWDQNNHHTAPSNCVTSRLREPKDQRNVDDTPAAAPKRTFDDIPAAATPKRNVDDTPAATPKRNVDDTSAATPKRNVDDTPAATPKRNVDDAPAATPKKNVDDISAATPMPHSNSLNTTNHPNSKELPDKTSGSNGGVMPQRTEKENSLGNTDWKPIRWSRSGNLASRGSSFSHTNSSKSLPVENFVSKSESPLKIATPSESPSGDALACTTPTSMEDISSRKKPRLGWGEGLAKYEKKTVVGSFDGMDNSNGLCHEDSADLQRSGSLNLSERTHSEPRHSLTPSMAVRLHSPTPTLAEHLHSPTPTLAEHLHSPTPTLAEHLQSPTPTLAEHLQSPTPTLAAHLLSPAANSAELTHSPVAKWSECGHSPCMQSVEPMHSPSQNLAEPLRSTASNLGQPMLSSPSRNLAETAHLPASNLAEPMLIPASNLPEAMRSPSSNLAEAMRSPSSNLVEAMHSPSLNLVDVSHSPASNLADKSPRYGGFDCVSPTTPSSSVACSSSPGLQEKQCVKVDVESDAKKSSPLLVPRSPCQLEGVSNIQENVEPNSCSDLSGVLSELLQSVDNFSQGSGSLNYTALNKLLQLKGEILNTLELTESEIDSRENELRLLRSKLGNTGTCPESSSSLSGDNKKILQESPMLPKPPPLRCFSSGDAPVEDVGPFHNIIEHDHADIKAEDVDSPGSATSKRMESLCLEYSGCSGLRGFAQTKDRCLGEHSSIGAVITQEQKSNFTVVGDGSQTCQVVDLAVCRTSFHTHQDTDICSAIYLSNKETASRASEVFCNLLRSSIGSSEPGKTVDEVSNLVKMRFLEMKQAQRFKERILSLKYKAFRHLWKEELRMLSIKKLRSTSLRRVESSSRSSHSGFKRHRSSVRSRFGSQGSNVSLVPASKVVQITSKLLSDPQIKVYRDELKMPALFLDEERRRSRFLSNNGLIQDPCAAEKERSMINPWTEEEKKIFLEKLAICGKDFGKISSFIVHKTTADCVEFYYKNHKSECFRKTKRKLDLKKQDKGAPANRYLMTSGTKWNREMNTASLDVLGAASAIVAHVDEDMESVKLHSVKPRDKRYMRGGIIERSSSFEVEDERDTEAADVLAGICGSLSSEAMSSCITSSIDPADGTQDWKCQRTGSGGLKRPPTPEVNQNIEDDTCSDESCGDVDTVDWTDEEKSVFVQAFSSYGKDFVMISQYVGSKSRDQCKVFFSKARKCLGLDSICPVRGSEGGEARAEADGGRSDTEGDACIVENDSAASSDKSGGRMDENMPASPSNGNNDDGSNNIGLHDGMGDVKMSDPGKPEDDYPGMEMHNLSPELEKPKEEISKPACIDVDVDREVENHKQAPNPESSNVPVAFSCEDKHMTGNQFVSEPAIDKITTGTSFPVLCSRESEVSVGCDRVMENREVDESVPSTSFTACSFGREERVKRSSSTSDLQQSLHAQSLGSDDLWKKNLSVQVVEARPLEARTSSSSPLSSSRRSDTGNAQPLQVYLKKCNRSAMSTSSVRSELPLPLNTHSTETGVARPVSDTDKPICGGVKLFGQILSKSSSTVEKSPSPNIPSSDSNSKEHSNYHLQPRPRSANGLDLVSTSHETEKNLFHASSGNGPGGTARAFPVRSYGFWDGTRIRTGFSTLPDSAALLAKYPSAFANDDGILLPSLSSMDQTQRVAHACEPSLLQRVGSGLIQRREMCSTSVEATATVHDLSLAYPTQHNRDLVSGLQPVKMNLACAGDVNGVAGAGAGAAVSCAPGGLTDPVTALKLHYARTQSSSSQQNGFHGGIGGMGEVKWRGQNGQQHGDLGR